MTDQRIERIAIIGTGVIAASWAAHYPARGFDDGSNAKVLAMAQGNLTGTAYAELGTAKR